MDKYVQRAVHGTEPQQQQKQMHQYYFLHICFYYFAFNHRNKILQISRHQPDLMIHLTLLSLFPLLFTYFDKFLSILYALGSMCWIYHVTFVFASIITM